MTNNAISNSEVTLFFWVSTGGRQYYKTIIDVGMLNEKITQLSKRLQKTV